MDKLKLAAQKHWPTGLIVSILIAMTAYFSTGKIDDFSAADAACMREIKTTCEKVIVIEKRIDKIETTLPYTIESMKKNTATIEKMAEDVQEIKILMISTIKSKEKGE